MSRTTLITIVLLFFAHTFISEAQNKETYGILVKFVQFYSVGDLKNAEECLLKILESKEPIAEEYLVVIYNNLGSVNRLLGKYNESLEYYHLAENLVINQKQSSRYLADIYVNIGGIYSIKRSFPEAIKYLERGIRIYSGINNPDKMIFQNISTGYMNLGLTYYKIEDYKQALEYLQKSSTLKLKLNLSEKALTYLNIAKVYVQIGDLSKSEIFFLKSIDEFEKEYGPNYYRITSVFFDYGLFLSSVGREQEAFEYFQKALNICLKTYSNKHPFVSLAYKHIGDHYMKVTDYNSALINYQKALTSGVQNFNNFDINSNPSLDSVLLDVDLLRCLHKKSEALMLLALQQDKLNLSKQLMKQSLETIEVILQLISNIRNNFVSEESQTYLAENEKNTYFFATQIAQNLYSLTTDPTYIQLMFKNVLLSKAAVLSKGITKNELFYSTSIPEIYRHKLNKLNIDIAAYENLILEESRKIKPDKKKLDFWKDVLFEMNSENEKVEELINIEYPEYHSLLQKTEPVSLSEIQGHLTKDETVIDYLLSNQYSEGKRKLYSFIITNKNLQFRENDLDSQFLKNVEVIRNNLTGSVSYEKTELTFNCYTAALFYMYDNLIKPVEGLIDGNRLIIIPDEEIGLLPFDAFLKSKPTSVQTDYEGLKYLINDFAISFGYSSSLIFGKENDSKADGRVIAFSPDNNINGSESIPGTVLETNAIFRLFRGQEFKGDKATETNFREAIQTPAIIHLAMHSLTDSTNSRYSYLMFNQQTDTLNDGKLFNYEVSLSRVNSSMVVLSACNSGTGTLYHGEGLMSLARGFILAGASTVIKTAWEINDETSATIITRFYYHLSRGKPKDEALRLAKLEYIKGNPPIYSNPYYWAAYEVLGDNSGILRNTHKWAILITTLTGLIVLVLMIVYFKRRRIFFARSL